MNFKKIRFHVLIILWFCMLASQAQTIDVNQKNYTQSFDLSTVRYLKFVNGSVYVKMDDGYNYGFILQNNKTLSFKGKATFLTQVTNEDNLSLYPNPVKDVLNFNCSHRSDSFYQVQILSIEGKILYDETVANDGQVIQIDLTTLSKGLYIFKAVSNIKTETAKFIKQ